MLFILTRDEEQLKFLLKDLNKFHPNLQFRYETSQHSIHFLDLNVSLKLGAILTDVHIKPTNGHQFLHFQHLILAT